MMTSFITEKGTRTVRHIESAILNKKKISKVTFSVNLAKFSTPSHKGGFLFLSTQITVRGGMKPVTTSHIKDDMLFQRKILP